MSSSERHPFLEGIFSEEGKFVKTVRFVAFIVGFALQLGGIMSLFFMAYGMLPITAWTDEMESGTRVPRLNQVYFWILSPGTLAVFGFGVMAFFFHNSFPSALAFDPASGAMYAKSSLLAFAVSSAVFNILLPNTLYFVFDIKSLPYYTFRGIPFFICSAAAGIIADVHFRKKRRIKEYERIKYEISEEKRATYLAYYESKKDTASSSQKSKMRQTIEESPQNIMTLGFALFYSILLLPAYEAMSDWMRVLFVVVLHAAAAEWLLFSSRRIRLKFLAKYLSCEKGAIDEEGALHSIAFNQGLSLYTETALSFIRRCLISSMTNPIYSTIAIMASGIEEVFFRTTLRWRDKFLHKRFKTITFAPQHAALKKKAEEKIWQITIGNSMMAELFSIIARFSAIGFLWSHRYVINLGVGPAAQLPRIAYYNFGLEILSEVIVDMISVYSELSQNIAVNEYWWHYRTRSHVFLYVSHLITGTFLGIYALINVPTALFCDADEPCTCDVENSFFMYKEICSYLHDGENTTKLELENTESIMSGMSTSEASLIMIGICSFIGIAAIAFAAHEFTKRRKSRRVASYFRRENSRLEVSIQKLSKKFTEDQQKQVEQLMQEKRFEDLKPYAIAPSHLDMIDMIGSGASGEVWKALYRSETLVAVKKILVQNGDTYKALDDFRKEALVMTFLQGDIGVSHPALVQMLHCCWKEELLIVIEYFEKGSLDNLLDDCVDDAVRAELVWSTNGEPATLQRLMIDVASGMCFMHAFEPQVIHRDLKPANVLIAGGKDAPPSEWAAKISDFGESRTIDTDSTMTMKGSPLFMAPEVILSSAYDHTCDMWSFGMMLLHVYKFQDGGLNWAWTQSEHGRFSLATVAKGGKPYIPEDMKTSDPALDAVIRGCLETDFRLRIQSFQQIIEVLNDGKSIDALMKSRAHSIKTSLLKDDEAIISAQKNKIAQLQRQLKDAERKLKLSGQIIRKRKQTESNHS